MSDETTGCADDDSELGRAVEWLAKLPSPTPHIGPYRKRMNEIEELEREIAAWQKYYGGDVSMGQWARENLAQRLHTNGYRKALIVGDNLVRILAAPVLKSPAEGER